MNGLETIRILKEMVRDAEALYNSRVQRDAPLQLISEAEGRWVGLKDALRAVAKEWGNVR